MIGKNRRPGLLLGTILLVAINGALLMADPAPLSGDVALVTAVELIPAALMSVDPDPPPNPVPCEGDSQCAQKCSGECVGGERVNCSCCTGLCWQCGDPC
jgi:hypothetical protein